MKNKNSYFFVIDYFDNYDNGGLVVGLFDTIEKANLQCNLWYDATDGECDLEIVQGRILTERDKAIINRFQ